MRFRCDFVRDHRTPRDADHTPYVNRKRTCVLESTAVVSFKSQVYLSCRCVHGTMPRRCPVYPGTRGYGRGVWGGGYGYWWRVRYPVYGVRGTYSCVRGSSPLSTRATHGWGGGEDPTTEQVGLGPRPGHNFSHYTRGLTHGEYLPFDTPISPIYNVLVQPITAPGRYQ